MVAEGRGQFRNGEVVHRFGPGDVLFVPAGVVHRFEAFSDDSWSGCSFTGLKAERRRGDGGAPDGGGLERTLPREAYLAPEYFAREKERIFCREWVCVGRAEELAAPGDYVVKDVAGESILIVRTRDGGLGAHYNVCRHRGSQLVPDAAAASFAGGIRCPYHSWTYTLEGELRTAPFLEESDGLARSELSLHPVGVETWGGLRLRAISRRTMRRRGAARSRRSSAACRSGSGVIRSPSSASPGGSTTRSGQLEGHARELQRVLPLRAGAPGALPARAGVQAARRLRARLGARYPASRGRLDFHRQRHHQPAPFEGLDEDERIRHKGELVYPNFLLSLSAEHVAAFLVFPHGPDRTTIVNEFLFHPSRDGEGGLRSGGRGGVLGPGEPAGLGDLRVGAAGDASRVFRSGYYAPMESCEPRHPPLHRRTARRHDSA